MELPEAKEWYEGKFYTWRRRQVCFGVEGMGKEACSESASQSAETPTTGQGMVAVYC